MHETDNGQPPIITDRAERAVLQRNWLWRLLQPPVWLLARTWLRVSMYGQEHLDRTRGGLMLINHQSFLDPVLVAVLLDRPISFLARDSLFKVPVLGWILRKTYVIPISRESVRGNSIRTAIERLEEGFLVGIFPEGTRSSGTDVRKFRPGFLALARRTSQPIYPVAIAGADQALPRGAWFVRPGRIQVVYGEPLTSSERERILNDSDDAGLAELARLKVAECQQQAIRLLQDPATRSLQ